MRILAPSLICVLLSLSAFGQYDSVPHVRILSWNIFMLPRPACKSFAAKRAYSIGQVLDSGKYDVIIFQEAFSARSRRLIYGSLQKEYPFSIGPANRKVFSLKTNSGIWILSKYPIVASHAIQYSATGGADALSRKGALMAEIEIGKNRIQIVGTHLQSAGGADRRMSQCAQLFKELLVPFRNDHIPQIICGDLNIDKYAARSVYNNMLFRLNALDGHLDMTRKYSFNPSKNDLLNDTTRRSKLIDYILLGDRGRGANFVTYNVVPIRSQWSRDHADLSDHYAMEAQIELNPSILPDEGKSAEPPVFSTPVETPQPLQYPATIFTAQYQHVRNAGLTSPGLSLAAGRQTSERWSFGITAFRTFRSDDFSNVLQNKLKVKLAGMFVDYQLIRKKAFSVSFPVMLGVGSVAMLSVNTSGTGQNAESLSLQRGSFVRPGIDFHLRLSNVVSVVAGAKTILFTDSDKYSFRSQLHNIAIGAGINVSLFPHQ